MGSQPPFTFEAQPSRAQVLAAVHHISRRRLWVLRAFGALVFLYGLGVGVMDDLTVGFRAGAIAFFTVLGAVVAVLLPWIAVRRATAASLKVVGLPCAYRVDADGVWSGNAYSEGTVRWPLVTGIEEVADLVLVRLGRIRFIPLPVGGLDAETRGALVAFLRDAAARPPAASRNAVRSFTP